MTDFKTISFDNLALVTGGNKLDIGTDKFHFVRESDPEPPDPEPYLRCRKQAYDQSPLWDQWFRPNREDRIAERACSVYKPRST